MTAGTISRFYLFLDSSIRVVHIPNRSIPDFDQNFLFSFLDFFQIESRPAHVTVPNLLCTHGNKSSSKIKNTYRLLNCTCIPLVFYICHFTRACFTRLHMCTGVQFTSSTVCTPVITFNHIFAHIFATTVALPNHHYNNVEHTYMPSPNIYMFRGNCPPIGDNDRWGGFTPSKCCSMLPPISMLPPVSILDEKPRPPFPFPFRLPPPPPPPSS